MKDRKENQNLMIKLLEGERIDDLDRNGYKIIQNSEKFCFGMDAVLLSGFAKVKPNEKVLDLGTGTGVIPILLEAKTQGKYFAALEIQSESADMARRSVSLNSLENKIEVFDGDIKEASKIFGRASFDVVTTNPPYMNENHGLKNPDMPKAIARHEILLCLEDVIREASFVLKGKGRFYMVHRPHRLVEIINLMTKYKLEPKTIQMVHPYKDKEANMVLIEGIKGSNGFLKVLEPIIVYKEKNIYTDEVLNIYGK